MQSGFLITSLLLDEWYRTGEVRLRNFYARRALRLLPALFAVVLFAVAAMLTFGQYGDLREAWLEVWGALFYVQNWLGAFGVTKVPFYLSHVWSLSIEEQFYLVAPVGIVVLLFWQRSLRRAIPLILVGVVASAVWMGVMASRTFHPLHLQRLYYGTDTRAQALLIGVALAFAVHSGVWLRTVRHDRIAKVWGLVGMAVLVVLLFTADIRSKPMYFGFFLVCSVSVAGILSELVRHPAGPSGPGPVVEALPGRRRDDLRPVPVALAPDAPDRPAHRLARVPHHRRCRWWRRSSWRPPRTATSNDRSSTGGRPASLGSRPSDSRRTRPPWRPSSRPAPATAPGATGPPSTAPRPTIPRPVPATASALRPPPHRPSDPAPVSRALGAGDR